jgi:hypothetical protein
MGRTMPADMAEAKSDESARGDTRDVATRLTSSKRLLSINLLARYQASMILKTYFFFIFIITTSLAFGE